MRSDKYRKVPTTPDVWNSIRKAHHDELKVFSSFTQTEGTGIAHTAWEFHGHDFPIMEAETTWDIDPTNRYQRYNEQTKFWLCCGVCEED